MEDSKKNLERGCKNIVKSIEEGVNAFDLVSDSYDITYTVDDQLRYNYGSIAVALGGPNIYITTNSYNDNLLIEGYWGMDRVELQITDSIGLDDYLEERYNETRGC